MRRVRGYHILFAISLLVLGALGAWWLVFFMRSVELEKASDLNEAVHVAVVTSLMLGQQDRVPAPGTIIGKKVPVQIVRKADRQEGDRFSPMIPRHPHMGVRPAPVLVKKIEAKAARRRLMFIGEGALLFLLLGVCTSMLFRLVRSERRHKRRMEIFLSAVTHEMKTPLAGLKSMLQTFAAGKVPDDQKMQLYSMGLKEAERLEHMVENVLISGRLRAEGIQVYKEAVEIRPLLEGFVEHRRRYLVDRPDAIELHWEAGAQETKVICDQNALNVVLENLTDNAFKYGGEAPVVGLRVKRSDGWLRISVEDRGIGFDPAKAEQLFIPFHRAFDARETVQHGTGLGLAIARALVDRMGGELSARSEGPGQGSEFTVSLREA